LRTEQVIERESAGRRCGVCRSGRGWRRFELVRPAGREPIVLCGGCRARFEDDPPVGRKAAPSLEPVPAVAESLAPAQQRSGERGTDRRPDRLRAALDRLPGSFSTAMASRAAGLSSDKALARLEDLERRGAVRRVGKRWSPSRPRARLPRRWIGFRSARATFGSSGSELGSADVPRANERVWIAGRTRNVGTAERRKGSLWLAHRVAPPNALQDLSEVRWRSSVEVAALGMTVPGPGAGRVWRRARRFAAGGEATAS
jgi:hypothetical protein